MVDGAASELGGGRLGEGHPGALDVFDQAVGEADPGVAAGLDGWPAAVVYVAAGDLRLAPSGDREPAAREVAVVQGQRAARDCHRRRVRLRPADGQSPHGGGAAADEQGRAVGGHELDRTALGVRDDCHVPVEDQALRIHARRYRHAAAVRRRP